MRVFVWLAYKNEHLNLYVGNVLERKTCMNNKKLMDSSTDGHGSRTLAESGRLRAFCVPPATGGQVRYCLQLPFV